MDIEMLQRMLLIQSEEAAFDNATKEGEDKLKEFDEQVRAPSCITLLEMFVVAVVAVVAAVVVYSSLCHL